MIPSNSDQLKLSLKQNEQGQLVNTESQIADETSKEEMIAKELFASLSQHASAYSKEQLFSSLSLLDEDCNKIHTFCQNLLSNLHLVRRESLADMTVRLLQIAAQLENSDNQHPSSTINAALNKLHFEINEINEIIQLKSYFDCREKLRTSLEDWNEELRSIKKGGFIDFSSKNYLAVLEQSRVLISSFRQLMESDLSPDLQKHLMQEFAEQLEMVAKAQKFIISQIDDYFEKYLQVAKNDLENTAEESEDFQESFSTFEYFINGLNETIQGIGLISAEINKELNNLNDLSQQRLPFLNEINVILNTLEKNQEVLRKISKEVSLTQSMTIPVKPRIDVAKSWDSLQIRHLFRMKYPKMVDTEEAFRTLKERHFQIVAPMDIKSPPAKWRLNSIRKIAVAALYCLKKLKII